MDPRAQLFEGRLALTQVLTCSVGLVSGRLYEIPSDGKKKEKEKTTKDYQLFSLFSEFNDKSGESDKKKSEERETTRQIGRLTIKSWGL